MAETFLDRLKAEFEQLDDRLTKLGGFIDNPATPFGNLPSIEQAALKDQRAHMLAYHGVLGGRLSRLSAPPVG